MSMNAQEQLSALLDGELPEAEVPMAVRRITRDVELLAAAQRYSLIGDAMRDELPAGRPANLVARVRAGIATSPAAAPDARQSRFSPAVRFGGGFAVAASVALVALLALPGGAPEAPPPVLSATEVAAPAPEQRMMIQPVYTRAAGGAPDRLTRYYVNHSEFAPALDGRGALTRIIVIQPEAAAGPEDAALRIEEIAEGERGNAQ